MAEPFIPRDKPKSWIIAICAGLLALLGFGPLLFISAYFEVRWLLTLASIGFSACVLAVFAMWAIFIPRLLAGHYRRIEQRSWADQLW